MNRITSLGLALATAVSLTAAAGTDARPTVATTVDIPTVDITCTADETVSFSPGLILTLTPRETTITVDATLSACLSSDDDIMSGTSHAVVQGQMSCLEGRASGPSVYEWNTGETSTAQIEAAVAVRPIGGHVVLVTGRIVAGKFAGDTLVAELVGIPDEVGGCLEHGGVVSSSGIRVVTFIQPL